MSLSVKLDHRRKRLRYRCWHRGMREMDLLLGGFADRHLDGLSAEQLDRFEALLELPDPELYGWILGREPVPPGYDHELLTLIKRFKNDR
jgi:antitoxin CptB